jgi:hypothetical protein
MAFFIRFCVKDFIYTQTFIFKGGRVTIFSSVLFLVCQLLRQLCFIYKYPRRHMECVGGANGGKRVKRLACVVWDVYRLSGDRADREGIYSNGLTIRITY